MRVVLVVITYSQQSILDTLKKSQLKCFGHIRIAGKDRTQAGNGNKE